MVFVVNKEVPELWKHFFDNPEVSLSDPIHFILNHRELKDHREGTFSLCVIVVN